MSAADHNTGETLTPLLGSGDAASPALIVPDQDLILTYAHRCSVLRITKRQTAAFPERFIASRSRAGDF
jgi:hypothetical protein